MPSFVEVRPKSYTLEDSYIKNENKFKAVYTVYITTKPNPLK